MIRTFSSVSDISDYIRKHSSVSENLISAVISQLGYDDDGDEDSAEELLQTLKDTCNGGANSGVHGFIYYNETVPFFNDNRDSIIKLAKNMADELGYDSIISFIKSFNSASDSTEDEIGEALYNPNSDEEWIPNVLAWFALETVANGVNE